MQYETHCLLKDAERKKGQERTPMPKPAVLLVDDSTTNLRVLRAMLNPDDYDLVAVDSSQAALDLLKSNPGFDLVLLDVAMPDLNGVEVCRRIKSDPRTRHIPVLLISGLRTNPQSVSEGLKAGADGYLMKPLAEAALRAWVKAALRLSRVAREAANGAAKDGSASDREVLAKVANLSQQVNDPLQAAWVAADLLASELPEDSPNRRLVFDILAQVDRVARLVADASVSARERLDRK